MALFLLGGVAVLGVSAPQNAPTGVLGGPAFGGRARSDSRGLPEVVGRPVILAQAAEIQAPRHEALEVEDASAKDMGQPIGPAAYRPDIVLYRAEKGDTLSGIAAHFGVSVQTLIDANPKVRAASLQIGEELVVLPVSGFVYTTRSDDTLESIAALFRVSEERIREINPFVNFGVLGEGVPVVVPGARRPKYGYASALGGSAPDLRERFVIPTEGFNWSKLHAHNAVDFANNCGTPVGTAAEGLVIPDESYGDGITGWNGGYGHFVLIEHPFGDKVRTRYAHLDAVSVDIGTYIKQGEPVGTIGRTGDATGCHLHFEVYGAKNPFAKY